MSNDSQFTFQLSLSILNHLGRNLYRSFITIIGEAISNSWDADAENVWLYINREKNYLVIKDDGEGMATDDFQNKFLKIGYSKRKQGEITSKKGRPYIGRKGIGKLAMLSCADRISIISKTEHSNYIGGTIDNSGLDEAINQDLTPQEYNLGTWEELRFSDYIEDHSKGTIVCFDGLKAGIKNTIDYLRYAIALYFRFSLLDSNFDIYLDEKKITIEDLSKLVEKTQFLWRINQLEDPYIDRLDNLTLEKKTLKINDDIKGFIATVKKPPDLKVQGAEEKASIDIFVNGRLRERNIIAHITTARIPESYMYGQIHYNELDDEYDRFTTGREGIKLDDPKYKRLLQILNEEVINNIINQWDKWRRKHQKSGDPENMAITKEQRKAKELFDVVSKEYSLPKGAKNKKKVNSWIKKLADDAQFNLSSYAQCFISENLIRRYIDDNGIVLSQEAKKRISIFKNKEENNKDKGNISIDIRRQDNDLSYLAMDDLANLVDKEDLIQKASLSRDAKEYKPIRDALAHTALLTDDAKKRLSTVYKNITRRVKTLLSDEK